MYSTLFENCRNILLQAILLLVIQCLIATFLDAVIVGCIFIKISKPKNRTDTIIFSDKDSFQRLLLLAILAKIYGQYGHFWPSDNFRASGLTENP